MFPLMSALTGANAVELSVSIPEMRMLCVYIECVHTYKTVRNYLRGKIEKLNAYPEKDT